MYGSGSSTFVTTSTRGSDEIVAERGLDRGPTYPGLDTQATAVGNRIDYTLGSGPPTERALARIARERLAVLLDEQTPHLLGALRGLGVAL
jgi:hypothetical protein